LIPPSRRNRYCHPATGRQRSSFFGTKEERTANITAMVNRLLARRIRVIVYDPIQSRRRLSMGPYSFQREAHAKIAARLAAQITAPPNLQVARSAEMISRYE